MGFLTSCFFRSVKIDDTVKSDIPLTLKTAVLEAARSDILQYRDSTMEFRQV